jgi:hypothetical protein
MSKTRAGIVDLCDALRALIQAAPLAKRRAFIEVFENYAARYPETWVLLQSPNTPSFVYHVLGDLLEASRTPVSANRPMIRGETWRVFH